MRSFCILRSAFCINIKNALVWMLDKIKEEPQGVAVVDLLRLEGVLVLVKYSAKMRGVLF